MNTPSSSGYVLEKTHRALVFRMEREQRANAFCRSMLLGLGNAARIASCETDVRCLIITASGQKHFCAGADLQERAGFSHDQVREQLQLYRSELGALDECSVPVIAAINGTALGGGVEIALACDLRTAVTTATFGFPECGIGVIPGAGGTQRLPRLIGAARAKEMILLQRSITSEQALRWGLINRICPEHTDLLVDTLQWLEPILDGAPVALSSALSSIDASQKPLCDGLQLEAMYYDRALVTEDRNEGLRAFATKTKPHFKGK